MGLGAAGIGLGAWTGGTSPTAAAQTIAKTPIIRDFRDPRLELIRLLNEAAEIEHDLMIQYIFGGMSLKPRWRGLSGSGAPNATSFLGVAVQEMHHLSAVNRLLVAVGGGPVLRRRDFPYEIDIYPFPFRLESLGREPLARYAYCEAPAVAFTGEEVHRPAVAAIRRLVPADSGANHVGSLYSAVISLVEELNVLPDNPLADTDHWLSELHRIKDEGEADHFAFFGGVLSGEIKGIEAPPLAAWTLDTSDAGHPAYRVAPDPTAYSGCPNTIPDPTARQLAWLGNLSYWASLNLLEMSYRGQSQVGAAYAQQLMLGPLLTLGRHLPSLGHGMPFDPLSMAITLSPNRDMNLAVLGKLLKEASHLEAELGGHLPGDYPTGQFDDVAQNARTGAL